MAKRSNRRWVSLHHPEAFEADSPISPHRADAHHGQESQNSTNRSDIRSQSYLAATLLIRSRKPGDRVLISLPNTPPRRGNPNGVRAERDELSTRPPPNQGRTRSRLVGFECLVNRICIATPLHTRRSPYTDIA